MIKRRTYTDPKDDTIKLDYIRINDIPEPERSDFWKWIAGQTMPIIPNENSHCAYHWDYEKFKEYYDRGEEAPVRD